MVCSCYEQAQAEQPCSGHRDEEDNVRAEKNAEAYVQQTFNDWLVELRLQRQKIDQDKFALKTASAQSQ